MSKHSSIEKFCFQAGSVALLSFSICTLSLFASREALGANDDQEAVADDLMAPPDYSGDWTKRPALTGDWGNTRQRWSESGFNLELWWYQAVQSVVSGGIEERWTYGTNLDLFASLDLDRMGKLPGAIFSLRTQSRFGKSINGDAGMLLPANTYSYFPVTEFLDEDVPIALTEMNYLQFLSEKVGLLIGKITTMGSINEFAGGEGRSQFMNFQFNYPATFAQVAPYSTLAVGGFWVPSLDFNFSAMFMNTEDASTSSGFSDIGEGTSLWASMQGLYRSGKLPGGHLLGGVYAFDGDFGTIGGLNITPEGDISVSERKPTSWTIYYSAWQYFYTEEEPPELVDPSDGRQDLEGAGLFLNIGLADKDTNPSTWSLAFGMSGRGLIPGRSDDTAGLGYFYNSIQVPQSGVLVDLLASSSQGVELYYDAALIGALALTIDLQWTRSAIQQVDDAVSVMFRLNARF